MKIQNQHTLTGKQMKTGKSKYRGTVNKECVKIGTKIILDENSAWVIAKAPDNTEINVKQPKEISKVIMKINTERSKKSLIEMSMHGHSFTNLQNATDSNYLIGNHTNKVSDKIIGFMIAAKTNETYTGYISHINGIKNGPKCPYCVVPNQKI